MTDPAQQAYEAAFPIANLVREAGSHQERALLLLQLSDAALLGHHVEIGHACEQSSFAGGEAFLLWRVTALCATRDAHGLLSDMVAGQLDAWRQVMSRLAAGEGADAG